MDRSVGASRPIVGRSRERLIDAADAEIASAGGDSLRMKAVATRAGVSRATAYRQLGSVSELLVQVALMRARRHVRAVESVLVERSGALAKIEAALTYSTRELPRDVPIAEMLARPIESIHDPRVLDLAVAVMGPVLQAGVRKDEIRDDLSIRELAIFIVEQTYLAAGQPDRSEEAVARRFHDFIAPVLVARESRRGTSASKMTKDECTMPSVHDAVESLSVVGAVEHSRAIGRPAHVTSSSCRKGARSTIGRSMSAEQRGE